MADESARRLMNELKDLQKKLPEGFSAGPADDDLYKWDIMIIGPEETPYEGGLFEATMAFPQDYPLSPPELRFKTYMHHPNIYPDGKVCISILHPPGDDIYGYEQACERWLPIYTVETIIVNVVSMLSSPNDESPANVDVAIEWRQNPKLYRRTVRRIAEKTQEGSDEPQSEVEPQYQEASQPRIQEAQEVEDVQESEVLIDMETDVEEEDGDEVEEVAMEAMESEEEEEDYGDEEDNVEDVEEEESDVEEIEGGEEEEKDAPAMQEALGTSEETKTPQGRKHMKRFKRQQRRERRKRNQRRKRLH